MAGLKTFWILIYSLLLLAACVPQTKQTECQGNEAFNAALRTCVPVVGGPSSFINVGTYSPAFTQTRHKADQTTLQFSISVSNPYNQTYTVAWERVFNGAPTSMCSNSLTCSFSAYLLGTTYGEVGTHILTAKILDGNGSVVDTHSFELKINEKPKPIINTASISPTQYAFIVNPGQASSEFKFTIKNNQTEDISSSYYRTEWTIEKNGAIVYTEIDTFTSTTPSGTNLAYLGTSPTPYFNPSTLAGLHGVGSYVVRAVVKNDVPGEIVDEHQWNVTVNHPALKKINSRDIYIGSNNPNGVSAVSIAYNGIAYTSATTYNFIPKSIGATTFTLQGNYCVNVENGDGTYVGDNLGVKVNFLIDGGPQIYSGTTTALNSKICLSDAAATTLNNMLFSNTTTTGEQNHTLVARVFDLATNQEYTSSDMPGLGNYPVTWNFLVKPANAAPTIQFATSTTPANLTSCSTVGNTQSCTVSQDTAFTVGITAVDDFYDVGSTDDLQQNKFTYTMTLMRNGSPLSTCTKTTTNTTNTSTTTWDTLTSTWSNNDFVGPQYFCGFVVPSYDSNGPVNPLLNTYSIVINFADVNSPILLTTPANSNTLVYNLNVTEKNTAPTVSPQGIIAAGSHIANASATPSPTVLDFAVGNYLTEGEVLRFKIKVNDTERDNHKIVIRKCSEPTCVAPGGTTEQPISTFVTKTDGADSTLTTIDLALGEDFIPISVASGTNQPVGFKVEVTDCPSILTDPNQAAACNVSPSSITFTPTPILPNPVVAQIFKVNVRNKNPAPIFGGTPNPATSASLKAMVGYPITLFPGTVTDASIVNSEKIIQYQWYVDPNGGNDSYSPIQGADDNILQWTPSNGIPSGTIVNLAICVSDGTNINPFPTTPGALSITSTASTGSNCLKYWNVEVKRNVVPVNYFGTSGDASNDLAIWQDTTNSGNDKKVIYSAYSDLAGKIYVEKTVFDINGNIFNNDTTGFRSVVFDAINGGGQLATSVKDISLAGTDTHLYIVYQAAHSSTPSAPQIRVRRIDKSYGAGIGSKDIANYPHPGKFGYSYNALIPSFSGTGTVNITPSSPGSSILVDFVSALTSGDTITSNSVVMTASDTPTATNLCSGLSAGCSQPGNAQKLANFINTLSNSRDLQGISADISTSQVTIYGSFSGGELLDTNTNVNSFVTGKLGKIMITGGKWYIPFVDLTTGSSLAHIRLLAGDAGSTNFLDSSLTVASNISYSTIGAVNYFTNDLNNSGNITIGSVNTSNIAQLHVFDVSGNPVPNPGTASTVLFGGAPVDPASFRMGVPATIVGAATPYYFTAAKVLSTLPSTYKWNISRCSASFICTFDNTEILALGTETENIFGASSVVDLSIEAYPTYSSEARILVSSYYGHSEPHLYSVRYRSDNKISCGDCTKIDLFTNATSEKLSPTAKIATARIDRNMTIGSAGSTLYAPNENIRDVLFAIFPVKSGAGNYIPHVGIFNANNELIDSTSSDTSGNLGHRPAFFSDL
jgi:hypothetical protein